MKIQQIKIKKVNNEILNVGIQLEFMDEYIKQYQKEYGVRLKQTSEYSYEEEIENVEYLRNDNSSELLSLNKATLNTLENINKLLENNNNNEIVDSIIEVKETIESKEVNSNSEIENKLFEISTFLGNKKVSDDEKLIELIETMEDVGNNKINIVLNVLNIMIMIMLVYLVIK
ncbi:hypothetical protein [Mycobacterium sp.]|uniref:hypothetical protein n=1 Tax=Mycobacterium sp. TaxID=1785 RepID=UPI003A859358